LLSCFEIGFIDKSSQDVFEGDKTMKIRAMVAQCVVIVALVVCAVGFVSHPAHAGDIMPGPRGKLLQTTGDIMPGPRAR
jgi:hypothetical protein